MLEVPTYAIRHPEAELALALIESRFGIERSGVFDAIGKVLRAGERLPRQLPPEPFVVVNGSGNYHHETVLLLESFLEQEPSERVCYVQIDAHPDKALGYRWTLSCGSFVGRVLENPRIDSVYLLGINPSYCLDDDAPWPYIEKLTYYRCDYFAKMRLFSLPGTEFSEVIFDPQTTDILAAKKSPAVRRVRRGQRQRTSDPAPRPVAVVDWLSLAELDLASLPPWPVYLTIDLDVARDCVVTDWRRGGVGDILDGQPPTDNHGDMEWPVLLELVRSIGRAREIRGADICGLSTDVEQLPAQLKSASLEAMVEIYSAVRDAIRSQGR